MSFPVWYAVGTAALFTATAFFLSALFIRQADDAASVVQNSAVVLAACFTMESFIHRAWSDNKNHYVLVHFVLGLCGQLIYVASYLTGPEHFQTIWRPIYFGIYFWDILMLTCRPSSFFRMYRLFYTIHHTVSFFITGSWIFVSSCCPWEDYVLRGICIWLSSDLYLYMVNIYRGLKPNLDKRLVRKMQLGAFVLERIHRSIAYIQAFVISGGDLNTLAWVVFGTGMFNDLLDAWFQARALLAFFVPPPRSKDKTKDEQVQEVDLEAGYPVAIETSDTSQGTIIDLKEASVALFDDTSKNSTTSLTCTPPSHQPTPRAFSSTLNYGQGVQAFLNPTCSVRPATRAHNVFCDAPAELKKLLSEPEFDRTTQWELSIKDFQKLTQERLEMLAGKEAFRVSNGPGMGPDGGENNTGSFHTLLQGMHLVGAFDMSLFDVVGVHIIGGSVVFIHGSKDQQTRNRERIDSISDVYCFGGTELGHGSNLKQVQTVAEFDDESGDFVLNTPSASAAKYWIGNSPSVADFAVVLSRIVVKGEQRGVGWLKVPLWNKHVRTRYPGVEVRDTGAKAGCNGIGNGCISFNGVRLCRDALLTQFCEVSKNGDFVSDLTEGQLFLRCIQTFVLERIVVATGAIASAKVALSIALRYASVRRQFGPSAESDETPLLSYPMHQRRLFTHIARIFGGMSLVNYVADLTDASFHPYTFNDDRKALHALSCLVKSFATWESFAAAQEARECCGGHGFAAVSQLGMARNDLDVTITFAGDNSLLALEVVRFRLKQVSSWSTAKKLVGPQRPLFLRLPWKVSLGDLKNPLNFMKKALQAASYREEMMLLSVAKKLRGSEDGRFDRFTKSSFEMREVASAVYDRMVILSWIERHASHSELYDELGMLNAVLRLQGASAWYVSNGVLSSLKNLDSLVDALCGKLAGKYEQVLDAFCVPEELVDSCPLVHEDYCARLYDCTYECDDLVEFS